MMVDILEATNTVFWNILKCWDSKKRHRYKTYINGINMHKHTISERESTLINFFSSQLVIHMHFPGMTSIIVMLTEDMHSFLSSRQALSDMLRQPLFSFKVNMQNPNATGHNFQSEFTDNQLSHYLPKCSREETLWYSHHTNLFWQRHGLHCLIQNVFFVWFCFQ